MKLRLQNSISSQQDLRAVIQEIMSYSHWLSQSQIKQKVSSTPIQSPPLISDAAQDLVNQWMADKITAQKGFDELLVVLEDYLSIAPTMAITLAALPSAELKKLLIDWCRQNITNNILVSFRFDSTILGGMVVRYGSHIYDWSFKRQILASRDKFPEVLRRV